MFFLAFDLVHYLYQILLSLTRLLLILLQLALLLGQHLDLLLQLLYLFPLESHVLFIGLAFLQFGVLYADPLELEICLNERLLDYGKDIEEFFDD